MVSRTMIEDTPGGVINMFHVLNIIVIRAEMLYARDCIEYHGVSPAFDVIETGEIMPLYEIQAIRDNNETYFKAVRVNE